jgi:hypothetical protein
MAEDGPTAFEREIAITVVSSTRRGMTESDPSGNHDLVTVAGLHID